MKLFFIITSLVLGLNAASQCEKYWVFFTDKDGVEFNPHEFFDEKAIERREKLGLDLYDLTDYPVKTDYLLGVSALADSTCNHSRWFNSVAVMAYPNQIKKIKALPFVKNAEPFPKNQMSLAEIKDGDDYVGIKERKILEIQTQRMGARAFSSNKINGKGIRIAVLDAGFRATDTHGMFHHIRSRNGILKTYDFIKNDENVYGFDNHGTAVLSCIAGVYRDEFTLLKDTFGLATEAEFLLARTEKRIIEVFSEEENWLAAVEWADKNGADIINSSLGYGGQRYSYKDMNGTQTLVSRAGNLAAKKGILVVNSAGNEGNGRWNFINAPADADSVLAVGGIHPFSGIQTPFSSVGPTFNNKFKPNVTAIAHVMAAQDDYIVETQGTSFSSPLVAGFAACVWQVNSDWNNMELFKALENGSDLYPYHDYAHGFGVPKAENFIGHLIDSLPTKIPEVVLDSLLDSDSLIITNSIQELDTTFMFSIESGELKFTIIQPSSIERTVSNFWAFDIDNEELKAAVDYEDYLFIHFRDKTGHITHYQVIDMLGAEEVFVDIPYNTAVIMCSYEGHSQLINYNP